MCAGHDVVTEKKAVVRKAYWLVLYQIVPRIGVVRRPAVQGWTHSNRSTRSEEHHETQRNCVCLEFAGINRHRDGTGAWRPWSWHARTGTRLEHAGPCQPMLGAHDARAHTFRRLSGTGEQG